MRTSASFRQAGGHWFEPSTAHSHVATRHDAHRATVPYCTGAAREPLTAGATGWQNPGVPEPPAATLEVRIGRAIDVRRATIEELVAAAVDRALIALVDAELDAALERLAEQQANGATPESSSSRSDPRAPTPASLCSRCGAEPRLPGRTIGRACKQHDDVARRARRRESRKTGGVDAHTPASDETRPADGQTMGYGARAPKQPGLEAPSGERHVRPAVPLEQLGSGDGRAGAR